MSDPTQTQAPADRTVKIPHLVFGLLFLGVAAVWALVATDVITEDRLTVIGPAILVGAGVIGLSASLASTRNGRNKRPPEYPPVSYPENTPEYTPETSPDHNTDTYVDNRDDVAAEPDGDDQPDDHTNDHTKEIR